jgi:hypothetical protein
LFAVAAFAVYIQIKPRPLTSKLDASGFGLIALCQNAIRHADRLTNAKHLFAVAAFAVYIQIKSRPLTSKLDASGFDLYVHGSLLRAKKAPA